MEKKLLSRTAKSNPGFGVILGQNQQELTAKQKQSHSKETIITKFHGLKKSVSAKLSFIHTQKL